MPRRRRNRRLRTSSQSSVEIQVTKEEAIITTSSGSHTQLNVQHVSQLQPKQDFLNLLRDVGAAGTKTSCGEIFTLTSLAESLIEYIRKRQLWDPTDPRVVHCHNDPLGTVFGVSRFTKDDTVKLLMENVSPVNQRKRKMIGNEQLKADHISSAPGEDLGDGTASQQATTPPETAKRPHTPTFRRLTGNSSKVVDELNSFLLGTTNQAPREEQDSNEASAEAGRNRNSGKPTSPSSEGSQISRRSRKPSFTIFYQTADGDTSRPWSFQVQLPQSDSESESYSVQGRVTEVVESSVDDNDADSCWVTDEVRIEIESSLSCATDPPFEEEFDPDSDSGSSVDFNHFAGSFSSDEECLIVHVHESDKEWWADSESSENESDISTDSDISEVEKWVCEKCGTLNTPVRSHCDCCFSIRPGWVEGPARHYPYRGRVRARGQVPRSASSPRRATSPELSSDQGAGNAGAPSSSMAQCTASQESDSIKVVSSQSDTLGMSAVRISDREDSCTSEGITVESTAQCETRKCKARSAGVSVSAADISSCEEEHTTSDEEIHHSDCKNEHAVQDSPCAVGETSTDIVTPSDEERLSWQTQEYETYTEREKRLQCVDSGISEGIFSSQDSVVEGRNSTNISVRGNDSLIRSDEEVASTSAGATALSTSSSSPFSSRKRRLDKSQSVDPSPTVASVSPQAKMRKVSSMVAQPSESNLCTICFTRHKNGALVHGKGAHQFCYPCCQAVWQGRKCCPVCRRRIERIVKLYE